MTYKRTNTRTLARITAADRNRLKAERRRTGLTPRKLFATLYKGIPEGLNPQAVQSWIDGTIREVRADWLIQVFEAWEIMPDRHTRIAIPHKRKPITARKGRVRVPLTGEMRHALIEEIARSDASYAMILANAPPGLNERLIRSWEAGQQASVDTALWEFVVERLASLPGQGKTI